MWLEIAISHCFCETLKLTIERKKIAHKAALIPQIRFISSLQGIFRVGGGAAKLRKVRAVLDGGKLNLLEYDAQDDIHAVAGALKQYFRELPDPLLTFDLFDQWIIAAEWVA